MIDQRPDDPDGPDPLAGRNPVPREQIDRLPLHDARHELLEEILSDPIARRSRPANRRVLVPVGIAAAITIVAGGAWFVASGDDGDDAPLAAASTTPTVDTTDGDTDTTDTREKSPKPTETSRPEPEPTETDAAPPAEPAKPLDDVKKGDVLSDRQCQRVLGDRDGRSLREVKKGDARTNVIYVLGGSTHMIAIDDDCTVIRTRTAPSDAPER